MAKDKKSFLLYCDLIHTVEKLSNEDAGEMFKHILRYVNDLNPETDNQLIDVLFEQIKQQLKRDLKKYENICERNKQNGKKGGRPKKPKKPSGLIGNPEEPKKPDSDTDIDTDIFKVILNSTEWRNQLQKNQNINYKELKRLTDMFVLVANPKQSETQIRTHFVNWLKYQDIKRQVRTIRSFDDITPEDMKRSNYE